MFTLTADQLSHLKTTVVGKATWAVAVHTTGTVDWDADHTTQAITQVNGPISRILVDTGTPVKQGDPLLYVASPDLAAAVSAYRKARNREAFTKRIVDRMKELLDQGAVAVKDYESSEADFNDARTDVQNSPAGPAHLRHHRCKESTRPKSRAPPSIPNSPSARPSPA